MLGLLGIRKKKTSTGFSYQQICCSFLFWPPYLSATREPLSAGFSFLYHRKTVQPLFLAFSDPPDRKFSNCRNSWQEKTLQGLCLLFLTKVLPSGILYHQHGFVAMFKFLSFRVRSIQVSFVQLLLKIRCFIQDEL